MHDLGRIVINDIEIVRMMCCVVLVVAFCGIKSPQGDDLSHNRSRKNLGLFQLRYVGLGDPFLLVVAIENGRPVLGSFIRTLRFNCVGSCATEKKTRRIWP